MKVSLAAVCALFFFYTGSFAQQYCNNYQYIIGERAAGMGGAYTALANDSTALWYNPAGLARIQDFHLNVTANTYSYLKTTTDAYWQLPTAGGGTLSINDEASDFSVVSNALIFGNKLGENRAIAFGIIIPYQDTLMGGIQGRNLSNLAGVSSMTFKDDYAVSSKYYLAMLGYGERINPALNIGASVGLGYYKASYTQDWFLYDTDASSYEYLETDKYAFVDTQYTIHVGMGAQWKLDTEQKLGLYVQAPTYRLFGNTDYKELTYSVDTSYAFSGTTSWEEGTVKSDANKQVLPGFLSVGYGYEKPGSIGFSLDVIPVFPVSGGESNAKKTVVNFKAGLEAYLSPTRILRAGVFTDFSQVKSASSYVDKIDYYGGTLSVSFGKLFTGTEIIKEGDKTSHTSVNRTLWSTFGLVARYGVGHTTVTAYDADYYATTQLKEKFVYNVQAFIAESVAF